MTSSYTTNKQIEKPANGDYNNTWSTPVNNDWDIIDQSLGGQTALNVVSVSGTVSLTVSQYRSPIIIITGLLTANVTYEIPAGVGGFWYVYNNTTGAYTVTFSNAGGGSTLTLAQGYTTTVISDGTNIGRGDTAPGVGGSGTVTSVNASGGTTGLTFSGGPITSSGTLTAGGTLIAANGGTGLTSAGAAGNVLTSNGTTWVSQAITGTVTSVTGSGSGISVSPTSGAVVVSNTGVTAATAGTGISVSGATGNVTFTNSGVTSAIAGTGISVSAATGGVTFTNSGVTSIVAGSGISISGATGAVTITATGGGGSGTFSLSDGSVTAPSLNFTNDTNTGLYLSTGAFTGAVNGVRAFYASDSLGLSVVGARTFGAYFGVDAGTGVNGQSCVAIGYGAIGTGFSASSGSGCTGVGYQSLRAVTATNNTALGSGAGFNITSGSNNTCIGASSSASSATASNEITLGNSSIATLRCQVTTITALSDARDKKDISPLEAGLEFINALKPVRFTWNMRPEEDFEGNLVQGRKDDPDTGFIAQDLKAVQEELGAIIPGLVYDQNPDKLEAGYGKLLPVLVKAIQELSAKVDALEAQLAGA